MPQIKTRRPRRQPGQLCHPGAISGIPNKILRIAGAEERSKDLELQLSLVDPPESESGPDLAGWWQRLDRQDGEVIVRERKIFTILLPCVDCTLAALDLARLLGLISPTWGTQVQASEVKIVRVIELDHEAMSAYFQLLEAVGIKTQ